MLELRAGAQSRRGCRPASLPYQSLQALHATHRGVPAPLARVLDALSVLHRSLRDAHWSREAARDTGVDSILPSRLSLTCPCPGLYSRLAGRFEGLGRPRRDLRLPAQSRCDRGSQRLTRRGPGAATVRRTARCATVEFCRGGSERLGGRGGPKTDIEPGSAAVHPGHDS